ncbi:MAG: hypothetical protein IKP87_01815, partial [Victivallales bacterium]|nr:hypothetical protein [Victivallales bacterium]
NNAFKVGRITVAHHDLWGNPPPKAAFPAAAFRVRVTDSEGIDAERFAKWRHDFMAANRNATVVPNESLDIAVQGESSELQIKTVRPFSMTSNCVPAPKRDIFAVNGKDIGKELLGDTPGIKEYFEEIARMEKEIVKNTIPVLPGQTAAWEAEKGVVVSNMAIGKDELASEGQFVWTPGEIGGKGGGNGHVTWLLDVKTAGTYYLWGCFSAPTPEDDSFILRASIDGQDAAFIDAEWHIQTTDGQAFQWRQFKDPLELPKGKIRLRLKTREDGTKVDRLFLTQDANDTP